MKKNIAKTVDTVHTHTHGYLNKIGIISINMYSQKLNFACPLHSYVFQKFLKENGINSTIIDYIPSDYDNFDLEHPYNYYYKRLEKCNNEEKRKELLEKCEKFKKIYNEREGRYKKFQNFINKYYKKTEITYDSDLLETTDPGFDCYICATDVIWKYEPKFGFDRGFFLASSCMDNKWKIAYAASRNSGIATEQTDIDIFNKYINDLDYISVREESLKEYIEKNTNKCATFVLDPVFLETKEFYENLLIKPKEKRYLLLYYVVKEAAETIRQAISYAKRHNLKIIEISDDTNSRIDKDAGVEVDFKYDIGIEEWLGYISNAEIIFTNSFHGSCFSIIFEKEFYAGYRNGDKVQNLLEKLGLSHRYFHTNTSLDYIEKISKIDYKTVNKKVNEYKNISSNFILSAIKEISTKEKKKKDYDKEKKEIIYKIYYHSGVYKNIETKNNKKIINNGEYVILENGAVEYRTFKDNGINNGKLKFDKSYYEQNGYKLKGYNLRFRVDNYTFWYLENKTFKKREEYNNNKDVPLKLFKEGEKIPFLPFKNIKSVVAVAVWEKNLNIKQKIKKQIKKIKKKIKTFL